MFKKLVFLTAFVVVLCLPLSGQAHNPRNGFVTGSVVMPDGTAFNNSGHRTDAIVYWWDTNRQWLSSAPLGADGSFYIPVSDSVYEISLWIDPKLYPNLAVPKPFYQEINGNTVDVGKVQLIQG